MAITGLTFQSENVADIVEVLAPLGDSNTCRQRHRRVHRLSSHVTVSKTTTKAERQTNRVVYKSC